MELVATDQLKVKELTEKEVIEIYNKYLMVDFPPSEQKPISLLLKRREEKNYRCFGLFDNEVLAAYAFFACAKEAKSILLDYLAVCSGIRSKGYGSKFLYLLKQVCGEYDGILFEVESGLSAEQAEELEICRKRLAFYIRNGLRLTKLSILLFGIDLIVMYLPLHCDKEDEELEKEFRNIYHYLYDEPELSRKIKIRRNDEPQVREGLL